MSRGDEVSAARSASGLLGLPSLSRLDGEGGLRIWLCVEPTDMRRGFDRLAAQAQQVTGQDPLSGHLFAFRNRRGDKLKLLFWDRDGYVLVYKRLEQGQFKLPSPEVPGWRRARFVPASWRCCSTASTSRA